MSSEQLVTALNEINANLSMLGQHLAEMNTYNKESRELFNNLMTKFMPLFERFTKPYSSEKDDTSI